MNTIATQKAAKNAAKLAWEPLETLASQSKPIIDEGRDQLMGFFSSSRLGGRPKEIAKEELNRARESEKIEDMQKKEVEDKQVVLSKLKAEYQTYQVQTDKKFSEIRQEVVELTQEAAQLAKEAGVKTNVHLENIPVRAGLIDVKRIKTIITTLKLKIKAGKSASDMVSERSNAKQATGMMAWVSGKQMKIHEQGTMQLQG